MVSIIPETTLLYLEKDNQYLMLKRNKKPKDINEGFWIGVGGHVEKDETVEECLIRETKEETGLDLTGYVKRGIIYFQNDDFIEVMHLFTSSSFKGNIVDCDEGELHWIDKKNVFDLKLWEGDKIFLKLLMNNEPFFELKFVYKGKKLIKSVRMK